MRYYVIRHQQTWVKWLRIKEYCYNSSHHLYTGIYPFKALYGYDASNFIDVIFYEGKAPKAKDFFQDSYDIMKTLQENLQMAQNCQKKFIDQRKTHRAFEEGEMVYLRL